MLGKTKSGYVPCVCVCVCVCVYVCVYIYKVTNLVCCNQKSSALICSLVPILIFKGNSQDVRDFPDGSSSKESACNAGVVGSISWVEKILGGGNGNP